MLTRHDLIFSNGVLARFSRHLLFWCLFGIGFYVQSIGDGSHRFYSALISLACFFPVCMLASYISLYVLLPRYLAQKKYIRFVAAFALLLLVCLVINLFLSRVYYALTCDCIESLIPFYKVFGLGFINTMHAVVIGGFALGVKFSENWYRQRKANQAMARQKILSELQLQRSRIYPGFIFHSMQKLQDKINAGSPEAPAILLKLSDLLSYILYDSEAQLVSVEKELEIMQHLIDLEKINQPGLIAGPAEITGDTQNLYIRPMMLFTFLQNCFSAGIVSQTSSYRFRVFANVERNLLKMTIAIEQTKRANTQPANWAAVLKKIRHEWEMLQAHNYETSLVQKGSSINLLLTLYLSATPGEAGQFVTDKIQPDAYEPA